MQLEMILLAVAGLWVVAMASVLSLCMAAQRGDARAREMAAARRGAAGQRGSANISRLPVRARARAR